MGKAAKIGLCALGDAEFQPGFPDRAEALESFNRKERNLLVRKILDQDGPPSLCEDFCNQVAQTLSLPSIPKKAWRATDYHISWLAGALAVFVMGEEGAKHTFCNPKIKDDRWLNSKKQEGRQLVEGNQEDVDLVITTGCDLILVEAKAYGVWDPVQLNSKIARLDLLHEFYLNLAHSKPAIKFHLLLISPERIKLTTHWPKWACEGQEIPWISLKIRPSVFEVTRCEKSGASDADGGFWHISSIAHRSEPTASA